MKIACSDVIKQCFTSYNTSTARSTNTHSLSGPSAYVFLLFTIRCILQDHTDKVCRNSLLFQWTAIEIATLCCINVVIKNMVVAVGPTQKREILPGECYVFC